MNMKTRCLLLLAGLMGLTSVVRAASDDGTTYATKQFAAPDMEWRPIPLWFWNNTTVTGPALESQLEKMVTVDGYGGCAILPFGQGFRPDYLSSDYMSLYGRAINKASALGAHMSVYDEYGFPSGSMGAINGSGVTTFKNNHPDHTVKRLDKTEFTVRGGISFSRELDITGKLMALVAMNTTTKEIVSLRSCLNDENLLQWDVPGKNRWRVMVFQCVTDGDPNVDYLSPEAVKLFVHDTHEAYYNQFPDAFGTTIVSTFFDEPTMYRAQGRMWTNDFNEKFEERYGFSPELLYPALYYDIGEHTAAARCLLFALHSTLYSEGFMKTIGDWADEHGILATGHQDQEEISNPTSVSGDLMLVGKHLSMPGIDKIGGGRPTENFYKVVSSSANCWDKTFVMSETYGAMGNIPVEQLYQIAIEQYTKGINHLIPHAVWYDDRNVTFLPELSWRNSLYNKDLPSFNRFLARLNYMLARPGRHIADVAMLYPIQTQYAGHYLDGPKGYYEGGVQVPGTDYPEVSRLLTDELGIDFTYLHPEVIDDRCTVADGQLHLNNKVNTEHFKVMVLPGVKAISMSNLKKIEEAWEAGVGIVFTTQTPSQSADLDVSDDEVKAIVDKMTAGDEAHRKAVFVASPTAATLSAAIGSLLDEPDVAFIDGDHPFNYLHKEVDGHDVYYFGNIDATSATCTIRLRHVPQEAMLLDPHTGVARKANIGDEGQIIIRLRPNQSVFLVDNALVVDNASSSDLPEQRLSYSITARVKVEQLSAGICLSGTDGGNFYMWQFNTSNASQPRLRPHRWMGGSASVLAEINLTGDAAIQTGEEFNVRFEVEDESFMSTYINDVLVDERSGSFAFGKIGFRQAHDDAYGRTEIARFDDVKITLTRNGQVVFFEDFSERNPFSEGVLDDGWLLVQGQMSHDILSWLHEVPTGILNEGLRMKDESNNRSSFIDHPSSIYDLQGRKVNGNNNANGNFQFSTFNFQLNKGVYICGGKKILARAR